MFERVAPSEEQRDAEAREGRSPDQIAALRLAAVLVLVDAVLSIAVAVAFGNAPGMLFLGVLIRLVMAYYLFKLRPRAEALALGLTILAGVATVVFVTIGQYAGGFNVFGFLFAIPSIGSVAALLMLLLGDPGRAQRRGAVIVFGVTVALPELLLVVLQLTGSIHQSVIPAE